jgi:cellulose synthase/poly-beta-1,6-N-acetylglucosamine synthase-like glycosyltransferase
LIFLKSLRNNTHLFGSILNKLFYRANAIRANRFVFAYEIPRILNRLDYYSGKITPSALLGCLTYTHCVGHGLFIKYSFIKSHIFPTGYIIEDMYYGFLLNILDEPVIPIPIFDSAEVPTDIKVLFFQMSRWFLGPSRVCGYYKIIKNKYSNVSLDFKNTFLILSGWFISAAWLLTSPFFIMMYILFILKLLFPLKFMCGGNIDLIFSLGAFLIFLHYSSVFLTIITHNLSLKTSGIISESYFLSLKDILQLFLMYLLVPLTHSFPAYYSLLDTILFNGIGNKQEKTERI